MASWQHLETGNCLDAPHDLDDEGEESGLVHELGAIVCPVGEKMLESWPALADSIEDHLGTGAVGDVGRGQVDH